MASRSDITPELLHQLLDYDHEEGFLTWKRRDPIALAAYSSPRGIAIFNSRFAGQLALTNLVNGYRAGTIFNIPFTAHRACFAIYHGAMPDGDIDHINRNRSDNRIANLRAVSESQNCRNQKRRKNNKSGVTGVRRRGRSWEAYIRHDGRNIRLGTFPSLRLAALARRKAEKQFGYHPNHGKLVDMAD